jgi:hypothetical protein
MPLVSVVRGTYFILMALSLPSVEVKFFLLLASSRHRFRTAVSPITGKKAKTLADRDGTTPSSFSVRGVGVAIDRIIFVKLKKHLPF